MIRVGTVYSSEDMAGLLAHFSPGNGPFVVVPNWHCAAKGYGTDAQTLQCLLAALPGSKIVVESYDAARTRDEARFQGLGLEEARAHREYLRREDQRFLSETGIGEVLSSHEAEYLNVTEEVWAGRTADKDEVARLVEEKTGFAVSHLEFYGMVPQRLWEIRADAYLIDYAKLKAVQFGNGMFYTLSMKNLFGLIPVPDRTSYHGSDDRGLSRSIVDMNQIYCSMFRTLAICEAIYNAQISGSSGFNAPASLVEDLGLAAFSDSTLELDAFLVKALGGSPSERHFLRMGAQVFGSWDERGFPALPTGVIARLREAIPSMADAPGAGTG